MTTRRQFLLGTAAIAGGFVIGCRFGGSGRYGGADPSWLTPYVRIDADGITLIAPRAEMGQGIHTTLAALVAEELDVDFEAIQVEHGPASEAYSNEIFYGPQSGPAWSGGGPERQSREGTVGDARKSDAVADRTDRGPTQATGGQTSIRDAYVKMRQAGAGARLVLIQAAAERLGIDPAGLSTRAGAVVDPDGREIPYVELAEAAAGIEPPADPPLKPRSAWKLLGRSLPRVDMVAKCTGTAEFGIDVKLPDLLYATVRRNPRLGGPMLGYDASQAEGMRGVVGIVPMESGVIVVATNTWYAFRAANAITFDWGPAPYPATDTEHRERIEAAFERKPYYLARHHGDVRKALLRVQGSGPQTPADRSGGTRLLEGTYRVPYLAHAQAEPMNATARLDGGRLEIWCGNQFPTLARLVGARLAGLPEEAVEVHTPYLGGGFGRRFEMDDVEAAVRAAQAFPGRPVRVTYTREEDTTHDTYRPMASARFRAAVEGGLPTALHLRLSAPSLFYSGSRRRQRIPGEPEARLPKADVSITMGSADQPYRIPNLRVTAHRPEELLPVGWWRSVGESQNVFFHESIVDEMAHAAGRDPLEMRLSLLEHGPSRRVLESVAEMSDWGSDLPPGHARGVAYALSSDLATAEIVEIAHQDGEIRLVRAFAAVDVGVALDPQNIEAQVTGAMLYGLSAAIFGEITIEDGAVQQTSFNTYPLLQLRHTPPIEVRIHQNSREIQGIGEAATPTAAPALGNAIFAATGTRIRELPFSNFFRFG